MTCKSELSVTIVTPEDAPWRSSAAQAVACVSELLQNAGIEMIGSAYAEIPAEGRS